MKAVYFFGGRSVSKKWPIQANNLNEETNTQANRNLA
jgi:hypothetical protein